MTSTLSPSRTAMKRRRPACTTSTVQRGMTLSTLMYNDGGNLVADSAQVITDSFTYLPYGEEPSTASNLRWLGRWGYRRDYTNRAGVRAHERLHAGVGHGHAGLEFDCSPRFLDPASRRSGEGSGTGSRL